MDERDRHAAFAHTAGYPLDRTGNAPSLLDKDYTITAEIRCTANFRMAEQPSVK